MPRGEHGDGIIIMDRNQWFDEAFRMGAMDRETKAGTWPSKFPDDPVLEREYRRGYNSVFTFQAVTPLLERDAIAISQLSNDEIRRETKGAFNTPKEFLDHLAAQRQRGPKR